jgi:hypothetical protein
MLRKIMVIKIALTLLALSLSGYVAKAANCTGYPLPYTLTNGTTADASQVMANFNDIINCVNALSAVTGPASSVAGHLATFADTTGKVLQDGGAFAVAAQQLANSAAAFGVNMLNGTIVPSNASNALTFTIQTLAGATPSASDPVLFIFRSSTAGAGGYSVVKVTAALSVTIPTSSTMGFSNNTPGRIWITAINNSGTVELAVINCLTATTSTTSIYPLAGWGIITTTALGGPSNSSQVFYSTVARSSVPYSVLGFATYEAGSTLATAGTWNANPSRMELYRHGVALAGQEVQSTGFTTGAVATGTTTLTPADSVPTQTQGDQYMSQAITPTSSANVLEIEVQAFLSNGAGGGVNLTAALFQDTTTSALSAILLTTSAAGAISPFHLLYSMEAGTASSTTFKLRAGASTGTQTFNGTSSSRELGGSYNSYIRIREKMG